MSLVNGLRTDCESGAKDAMTKRRVLRVLAKLTLMMTKTPGSPGCAAFLCTNFKQQTKGVPLVGSGWCALPQHA